MVDKRVHTDWIIAFDAIEEDCYYECDDWYDEGLSSHLEYLEIETMLEMEFGEVLSKDNLGLL